MAINRKEEIKNKIAELLKVEAAKIEEAAEELAPGFDYEAAEAELEAEEANEIEAEENETAAEEVNGIEAEENEAATEEANEPLPQAEQSLSKYPKERREYRSWLGRTFLQDANGKVLGATILLLAAVISWYGLYWMPLDKAEATTESIIQGKTAHAESIFERTKTQEETIPESKYKLADKTYYNTYDEFGNAEHSNVWFGRDGSYVLRDNYFDGTVETTGKWAISENTRLREYENKCYELETSFHNIHEELEVLKAKNCKNPILDTVSCILFVLGPLALGWLTSIADCKLKLLIGIIGAGLLSGAILIKIAQYFKS